MSNYRSYIIRIYRKKGRESLVGQITEVASSRKRSFATLAGLKAAVSRMLGADDAKLKAKPKRHRGPKSRSGTMKMAG